MTQETHEHRDAMTKSEQAARNFFTAIDTGDVSGATSQLAPDVSLQFGNDTVILGREEVSARLASLMSAVASLSHEVCTIWVHDDTVICELEITYKRLDGSFLTLPCVDIFRMSNDLIADYRAYLDITPLFDAAPL
jgi:ketosteroid isomerase-like protein